MATMRSLLKSKIHKARVTEACVEYVGSITIDEELMEKVDLIEGEQVMVVDNTNGARLFTYVIKGPRGSGTICMNGAAAHLIEKGDEVIIMAFAITDEATESKNILVDEQNRFVRFM